MRPGMSRPSRAGRLASSLRLSAPTSVQASRPKRRAAKTDFFKYQLTMNPSRAEKKDLKKALLESLIMQTNHLSNNGKKNNSKFNHHSPSTSSNNIINSNTRSSTSSNQTNITNSNSNISANLNKNSSRFDTPASQNSSRLSKGQTINNSVISYSSGSAGSSRNTSSNASANNNNTDNNNLTTSSNSGNDIIVVDSLMLTSATKTNSNHQGGPKRTRSSQIKTNNISNNSDSKKRNNNNPNCSINSSKSSNKIGSEGIASTSPSPICSVKRAKLSKKLNEASNNGAKCDPGFNCGNSVSPVTSTPVDANKAIRTYSRSQSASYLSMASDQNLSSIPTSDRLQASTKSKSKSNSNSDKQTLSYPTLSKAKSTQTSNFAACSLPKVGNGISRHNSINVRSNDTVNLSTIPDFANQDLASMRASKKRSTPLRSWSLLGIPEDKVIYTRDNESPKRLICYPAIKHIEGDVIQVRDSVLLRSGPRKTDLPFIAKVSSFWKDGETGNIMMSLLWYYRPEHTEDGRKPHQLPDEIFASRHRDIDSVECIEDKCYVLTFNEYCRYKKRCKMEQVGTNWSLTDLIIPDSSGSYPRHHRIPDSDVNSELVFCCRQIYDSRQKRLIKNPLINPKYGHI